MGQSMSRENAYKQDAMLLCPEYMADLGYFQSVE
jgi:hypothetical protein